MGFLSSFLVTKKIFWVGYLKNNIALLSVLGYDRGWLHSGQEKNLFNVTVKLCHNSIFLWPPIHSSYFIPGYSLSHLKALKTLFSSRHLLPKCLIPRYHTILLLNYDHKFQNTHNFSLSSVVSKGSCILSFVVVVI